MPAEVLVSTQALNHWFGTGTLRRQVLCDISLAIEAGEIVILTGPSGSGKTTLLSLIGALRSAQEGELVVLGEQLRGASERTLATVRRKIGYIFQFHNLLDALTASQNVMVGVRGGDGPEASPERAREVLESVGLGERLHHYPEQLSGGQKQRVAIARALAGQPRLVLADEPTASLDRRSGREVVDRIRDLAKREGAAVVLVTHDNRILDVADRIVHLEEGRLAGMADAVAAGTQQVLSTLAKSGRSGDIERRVATMSPTQFAELLDGMTAEAQQILRDVTMSADRAFEILLAEVLHVFTLKIGQIAGAERASLFLVDRERGELWTKVAQGADGASLDIRVPLDAGVTGHVIRTGEPMRIADAYATPLFNRDVDQATGYRTRSLLCAPIFDSHHRAFAAMMLLNKVGGGEFTDADERALRQFASSMGVILETWNETRTSRRHAHEAAAAAASA